MKEIPIEHHPWEPYLPDGVKLFVVGTFPPQSKRWSMEFFYPNVINDFWRIMGLLFWNDKNALFDTNTRRFKLDEIKRFLDENKIGVGDTALEVRRLAGNASDKLLEIVKPIDLWTTLDNHHDCLDIASTGEKAASVLAEITGTMIPKVGEYETATSPIGSNIRIWRMPSTSRAYPLAIEKKAAFYGDMLKSIGILNQRK